MNKPSSSLSIKSIAIHQDAQGRYSLGDLYRASGHQQKHKPVRWMRSQQTKGLVAEMELEVLNRASNSGENKKLGDQIWSPNSGQISPVNTVLGHGITDTYVVKELVYAYAMWISPAFHLHVIRAYDALISGRIDALVKPAQQHEKYWFARNPHWQDILPLALDGLRCTAIGRRLGMSPGRVSRAIRRMIEVGLMDPAKRISARFKPDAASRQMQLPFFATWGQPLGGH